MTDFISCVNPGLTEDRWNLIEPDWSFPCSVPGSIEELKMRLGDTTAWLPDWALSALLASMTFFNNFITETCRFSSACVGHDRCFVIVEDLAPGMCF